jgi:glycolate oxidase
VNIMAADYHADRRVKAKVDRALDELFAWVLKSGGAITGEHGIGLAKKPWWTQAVDRTGRDVHAALKAALDAKGILNPGKFVPAARRSR